MSFFAVLGHTALPNLKDNGYGYSCCDILTLSNQRPGSNSSLTICKDNEKTEEEEEEAVAEIVAALGYTKELWGGNGVSDGDKLD